MVKNQKLKLSLTPYNSLSKNSFYIISALIFSLVVAFSILWLSMGAWPITIFLGVEYIILCFLITKFYKGRKIKEDIYIDDEKIVYKIYQQKNLEHKIKFNPYWTKIIFWKKDNKSKLLLTESGKKVEIGRLVHTKTKEDLYQKLNNYLSRI